MSASKKEPKRCKKCGACEECGAVPQPQLVPMPYPVYPWQGTPPPYRPYPYFPFSSSAPRWITNPNSSAPQPATYTIWNTSGGGVYS